MKFSQLSTVVAAAITLSQVKSAPIVLTPEMQAQGIHPITLPNGFVSLRSEDAEKRIVITPEMQAEGFQPIKTPPGIHILRDVDSSASNQEEKRIVVTPEMEANGFKPIKNIPGMMHILRDVARSDDQAEKRIVIEGPDGPIFPNFPSTSGIHPMRRDVNEGPDGPIFPNFPSTSGIHPMRRDVGADEQVEKRIVIDGHVQGPIKMPGGLEISLGKRSPEPYVITPEMAAHGVKPLNLPPGFVALRDEHSEKRGMPLEIDLPNGETIPYNQLKHPLEVGQEASKRSEHSIPIGFNRVKPIKQARGMPIEFDFEDNGANPSS